MWPAWAPDGKTLFYRHGTAVIGVAVALAQTLTVGARRTLFEGPYFSTGALSPRNMAVAPDGKRFVMLRRSDDDARIVVVTNWLNELRVRTAKGKN